MTVKTWTLNTNLERRIDDFGNEGLRRIMGYHCNDFASNQRLLHETGSRLITSIVRQRQLQLYGHVTRYPDVACRVVSERDSPAWRRPEDLPLNSWMGQVDALCWELSSMGRGPAWRLVLGDHWGWLQRVVRRLAPRRMPYMID